MKHMCNEYPTWMSENREKLSEQEVRNYELQHRYMQEIVNMYDTGAPSATVMDKMQQMQDCGPPPPELLKKLAPGVDIGPDGMPKLQGGMPGGGDGQPCPVQ
jgi:peroxin-19